MHQRTGTLIAVGALLVGVMGHTWAQTEEEAGGNAVVAEEEAETPEEIAEGEPAPPQEADEASESEMDPEAAPERRRGVRRLGDVVGDSEDEWTLDIPEAPATPPVAIPAVRLSDSVKNARLQDLLIRQSYESGDPEFQMEVGLLLEELENDVRDALDTGDVDAAAESVAAIGALDDARPGLAGLRERIELYGQVGELLELAATAMDEGRLITPEENSALEYYQAVLAADEENTDAVDGIGEIQERLLGNALELADELDFEAAESLIVIAGEIREDEQAIAEAREAVARIRSDRITDLDRRVTEDIDSGRFDSADEGITQLIAMGGNRERIERLRQSLEDARLYGGFEPGQRFSDELQGLNDTGPEMVVIPAGTFMMGSPDNEEDRNSNEGPRFRVTFQRGFAMAVTEVTIAQFRKFVENTGYTTDADRQGWSRVYDPETGRIDRRNRTNWQHDYMGRRADDELPVIHVSWNDAAAYTAWLSGRTDRIYRLPSEAEYEYSLRAGSQTMYWWGEGTPDEVVENLTGDGETSTTRRRWTVAFRRYDDGHWGPAPVASFPPNPFGLHDMGGNVMSWTEDCWHDTYVRAPTNGSAWVNPGCDRRVLRGGSWSSTPAMSRSAFRLASGPDGRDARVGFRVARDL